MKRKSSVFGAAALVLVLAVGLAGCAGSPKTSAAQSGFLGSYSRLSEKSAPRGEDYLSYNAPGAAQRATKKVYLMPVATHPANANFDLGDKNALSQSLVYFDQAVRSKLGTRVALVPSAAEADTTLQLAVTSVGLVEEGRSLTDLIPLRLITKPLKDRAMGKPMQAAATLELRMSDAKTKQLVHESLRRSGGKGVGREGDAETRVTFESLKPVLDAWAERVTEEVASAKP